MVLADVMSRTGAFNWAARQGARLVKGNGFFLIIFDASNGLGLW